MDKLSKMLTIALVLGSTSFSACAQKSEQASAEEDYPVQKSEEEWRAELTDQEFYVLRQEGTERAFSSDLLEIKKEGAYICAACDNPVFHSEHKFESGTGWPSFYKPIDEDNVGTDRDTSSGMVRTEVHCARCGGHLGHVFDDGPQPTGLRYCLNGAAMDFKPAE